MGEQEDMPSEGRGERHWMHDIAQSLFEPIRAAPSPFTLHLVHSIGDELGKDSFRAQDNGFAREEPEPVRRIRFTLALTPTLMIRTRV